MSLLEDDQATEPEKRLSLIEIKDADFESILLQVRKAADVKTVKHYTFRTEELNGTGSLEQEVSLGKEKERKRERGGQRETRRETLFGNKRSERLGERLYSETSDHNGGPWAWPVGRLSRPDDVACDSASLRNASAEESRFLMRLL